MSDLVAALLGILQGLTEFLPVSSTAHLLIAGRLLGFADPGGVFTVMIQFGSILALMWLYRLKIVSVMAGLPSSPESRRFASMLLVAFAPAVVVGPLLADYIQTVLYESPGVIAAELVVGGVLILLVEAAAFVPRVHDVARTPLPRALGIGLCQLFSLIPGVSRSGATIIGGRLLGLDRSAAAEFSFFLAMPTMTAAFVYEAYKLRGQFDAARAAQIGVGFVFAFLAALVVVRPFLRFVARSGFAPFAWYRIVTGLLIFMAMAAGWL